MGTPLVSCERQIRGDSATREREEKAHVSDDLMSRGEWIDSHTFWPHVSHTLRERLSVSMSVQGSLSLSLSLRLSLFFFNFGFDSCFSSHEETLDECRLSPSPSLSFSLCPVSESHGQVYSYCCVMRNVSPLICHLQAERERESEESGKKKCSKLPRMCLIKLQDATDDSTLLSQDANKMTGYRSERGGTGGDAVRRSGLLRYLRSLKVAGKGQPKCRDES